MTVGSQVKQTLSSIKGAQAAFRVYYNKEQNQDSRVILKETIEDLNQIIEDLDKRNKELEFQEPQYKGQ